MGLFLWNTRLSAQVYSSMVLSQIFLELSVLGVGSLGLFSSHLPKTCQLGGSVSLKCCVGLIECEVFWEGLASHPGSIPILRLAFPG